MTHTKVVELRLYRKRTASQAVNEDACPVSRHEQARRKLFPFYRHACDMTRDWRVAESRAQEQREKATGPLQWLKAAVAQAEAHIELRLAQRHQKVIASQLDNERVNFSLGWPRGTPVPECPERRGNEISPTRRALTLMAAGAMTVTPLRPDALPLTPNQKLDAALAFAGVCGTGQGQPERKALCHGPKLALRSRPGENKDDITLA